MTDKRTPPTSSEVGAGQQDQPQGEHPGSGMKQAMAQMMANCPCGPGMMEKMAGLMSGCGPSKPAEPAKEKP